MFLVAPIVSVRQIYAFIFIRCKISALKTYELLYIIYNPFSVYKRASLPFLSYQSHHVKELVFPRLLAGPGKYLTHSFLAISEKRLIPERNGTDYFLRYDLLPVNCSSIRYLNIWSKKNDNIQSIKSYYETRDNLGLVVSILHYLSMLLLETKLYYVSFEE